MVGASLLASWPIGPADLVAAGLDNLRRRVRPVRPRDLHRDAFQGVPVRILQSGVGCASALVLVPDELERIFGTDRQCLIAPMRDLLISMPADTDRELVGWLNEEFSSMDPNGSRSTRSCSSQAPCATRHSPRAGRAVSHPLRARRSRPSRRCR